TRRLATRPRTPLPARQPGARRGPVDRVRVVVPQGAFVMNEDSMQRAWLKQAQLDAARGVIVCRLCMALHGLEETTTLWRNGVLVFAVCERCAQRHHIVMSPVEAGIEVRARARGAIVLRGGS